VVLAIVALITLLLTAFGTGKQTTSHVGIGPAPANRLLPSGPPSPQVVALEGALRIQLPIAQSRVTALGYHASGDGAIALQPLGSGCAAGTSKLGVRLDFSRVEGQALARYTQDAGNHVEIEVRPAAALATP